jgi:phenylacetate-CoA ligase
VSVPTERCVLGAVPRKQRQVASRLVLSTYDHLTGDCVWRGYASMRAAQWRSADELHAGAGAALRRMVRHAAAHVPHYRDLLREAGVRPEEIRGLEDLDRVPVTTKAALRQGFPGRVTVPSLARRRGQQESTSGSTGAPFEFYLDRGDAGLRRAAYLLFREWAGIPLRVPMLRLVGLRPLMLPGLQGLARRLLLGERQHWLGAMTATPATFGAAVRRLGAGEYFVWTHPAYAVRLARRLADEGARLERYPSVVVTFGETLTPIDASVITEAFRCRVVDHYSSSEIHCIAQTCPDEPTMFHVNSARVVAWVMREDGRAAAPGERGRLILTDLTNHVMPFLNYDIGDQAVAGPPCPCGRGFPTLGAIEGRSAEAIVTPDGRTLAPSTLALLVVNAALSHVWEYQAVQPRADEVILRVVPCGAFSPAVAERLRASLREHLGPLVHVTVEIVDETEPEPSGKRLTIKRLAE